MAHTSMEIDLTMQLWKEGDMYVSYSPELDISSCGRTSQEAKKNLREAVEAFLEESDHMGTLQELLEESGFIKDETGWKRPQIITTEKVRFAFSSR
ncbi:MAG: type II toxin-antitoxin system HicB family antitoxin [Ignavibacteriales bacterium]